MEPFELNVNDLEQFLKEIATEQKKFARRVKSYDDLREVFGQALGYQAATESPDDYQVQRNFTVPGVGVADGHRHRNRSTAADPAPVPANRPGQRPRSRTRSMAPANRPDQCT